MIQEILSNTTVLDFVDPIRIDNFSPKEKAIAWTLAQREYNSSFESGCLLKEELDLYLLEWGVWSEELEKKYEETIDQIQSIKVDYYDAFAIPTRARQHKISLRRETSALNDLFSLKNYLHEYTCEAVRDEAYGIYLFAEHDNPLLLYRKFLSSRISEEEARSLYFDNSWKMIWSVCKDPQAIFGLNMNGLNESQISLLYWSHVYDNIQESPESPSVAVMKDPIAVDGWLIKQSRKRDSDEKASLIPDKGGEIFMPVKSKQEAREIIALNSREGIQIIKSRAKDIKTKGDLDERQFSHVKRDIGMKINELSTRRN